jgi:hypothetical protein
LASGRWALGQRAALVGAAASDERSGEHGLA